MNSLIEKLKAISNWADKAIWRTWLLHTLLAIVFTLIFWPIYGSFKSSAIGACELYLIRELEQIAHAYFNNQPQNWLDHIMDVVTPGVVLLILILVF